MGRIEDRSAQRARREKVQNTLLVALYATTVIGLLFTAPNVIQLLKHVNPYLKNKLNPGGRTRQAITRLVQRGLVERRKEEGKVTLRLTRKGEQNASRLYLENFLTFARPRRWDERWRIVIFDVWEKRREVRRRLREILRNTGFVRLQDSVWIFPYDCEELVAFMRTDLRLGRAVLYFVADGVENDRDLRAHFKLPSAR
ncbi:CRISPR-associated endonuclease Cas2 [Candidatus Kaiserbacteria bacterium]|nr:CRISPR-associated endonuclease Cas2 [Candidatus Kaiserbacteria bacterium]